ncbi:MAG: hypothetical protein QM820_00565 [Minicystis sp.]
MCLPAAPRAAIRRCSAYAVAGSACTSWMRNTTRFTDGVRASSSSASASPSSEGVRGCPGGRIGSPMKRGRSARGAMIPVSSTTTAAGRSPGRCRSTLRAPARRV